MADRASVEETVTDLGAELADVEEAAVAVVENARDFRGKVRADHLDWDRQRAVIEDYEVWYNDALSLVAQHLPEREADFVRAYENTYEVLQFDAVESVSVDRYTEVLERNLADQRNLLNAVPRRVGTERVDARRAVSRDLVGSELDAARSLFDAGEGRAAGVVAGAALTRHLLTRCELADADLDCDRDDGIADLGSALADAGEVDDSTRELLSYLATVAGQCRAEEAVESRDVERLLARTGEFLDG